MQIPAEVEAQTPKSTHCVLSAVARGSESGSSMMETVRKAANLSVLAVVLLIEAGASLNNKALNRP